MNGTRSTGTGTRTAWLMVAIAALAQNCAIGLNFAAYGTMVAAIEDRFETSRALAAAGPGAMVLVLSLCSPLVGGLLQRWPTRIVMMLGAFMCMAGYLLLPLAQNIYAVLAIYGVLIGTGACLLGIVPAATLVGNWFIRDRGKALGIINMPILLFVTPVAVSQLLPVIGLQGVFLCVAALYLLLLLVLLFVIDTPESIGLHPRGAEDAALAAAGVGGTATASPLTKRELLARPKFWFLSVGVGLLTSGGTMIVVHFVPFGTGRGLELLEAALLISAFGGAGTLGALLFGWLVDRIGAANALILNALAQAVLWAALVPATGLSMLLPLAAALGGCAGAIIAIHGAALNELFGRESFSQAMGLSYLLKLPFIVIPAPLAGWLFELTGSYFMPLSLHVAAFVVAALLFLKLTRHLGDPAARRSASRT